MLNANIPNKANGSSQCWASFFMASQFNASWWRDCLPDGWEQLVELLFEPLPNQVPIDGKCEFRLVFRGFHHLEARPFGHEPPLVFLRMEFALVEQRLAADERGSLPPVDVDFKAELLHVHQLLEQRKPCPGFPDDGFQTATSRGHVCAYRRAKPPVPRCNMACFSRQNGLFQNAKQSVLQLAERQVISKNGPYVCL